MCCLRYEYDMYVEESRLCPSQGSFVNTPDGPGVVTEVYPLRGEVKVSLRNQTDSSPKIYKRDVVEPRPAPGGRRRPSASPIPTNNHTKRTRFRKFTVFLQDFREISAIFCPIPLEKFRICAIILRKPYCRPSVV
jgi:hypothetical protein